MKIKKSCSILILLGVLMLLCVNAYQMKKESIDRKKYRANAEKACVEVFMGGYHGCGTIIQKNDSKVVILTVRHLILQEKKGTVYFVNKKKQSAKVTFVAKEADMGLLTCSIQDWSKADKAEIHAVSLNASAYMQLHKTDLLENVAYQVGKETVERQTATVISPWWYCSDFDAFVLYLNCEGKNGISGSGVFNKNGAYVGMLLGGNATEKVALTTKEMIKEVRESKIEY